MNEKEYEEFLEKKNSLENRASEIAMLLNSIDHKHNNMADHIDRINFEDIGIDVHSYGYARGHYEESLWFTKDYLFMTNEEIRKIEENLKKERELKAKTDTDMALKLKEASERATLKELKLKYES